MSGQTTVEDAADRPQLHQRSTPQDLSVDRPNEDIPSMMDIFGHCVFLTMVETVPIY